MSKSASLHCTSIRITCGLNFRDKMTHGGSFLSHCSQISAGELVKVKKLAIFLLWIKRICPKPKGLM